ncbi:MAG TPA: sulfite exporter TauE/SafE family protein [Saprospiraceae bacterium]|nr:sulfite exporter TauE/SafE family protein [Saprospiraceae bacterium]
MYWIAISLGFLGSLHCIGMCGPLAAGMLGRRNDIGLQVWWSALGYNTGRTIGYMIIGLLFGLIGSMVAFAGIQKAISIGLGVIMVLFFVFSINPDHLISNHPWLRAFYGSVSTALSRLTTKTDNVPSIGLGLINGFLPCGLVYLAVAGALSLSNVWGSMGFMMFFGLGTFPAMMAMALSHKIISIKQRMSMRKIYPMVTLVMGAYLIYRGLMSEMPLELDFFEALKHPVMCH